MEQFLRVAQAGLEASLFLLTLAATLLAFASDISLIKHDQKDFAGIHQGLLALLEMTIKMFDSAHYETYESDALVLICVVIFLVVVVVSLLNMLVAQLRVLTRSSTSI